MIDPHRDPPRPVDIAGRITVVCLNATLLSQSAIVDCIQRLQRRFIDAHCSGVTSLCQGCCGFLLQELALMRERGDPAGTNLQRFFDTMTTCQIVPVLVAAPAADVRACIADELVGSVGIPPQAAHAVHTSWTRPISHLLRASEALLQCSASAAASLLCPSAQSTFSFSSLEPPTGASDEQLRAAVAQLTAANLQATRRFAVSVVLQAVGTALIITDSSEPTDLGERSMHAHQLSAAFASIPDDQLPSC